MRHSYIVDHLEVAKSLAEADGQRFLAYMIGMAIEAAKSGNDKSVELIKAAA